MAPLGSYVSSLGTLPIHPSALQGVLDFWEQQGLMADEHHSLRVEWSQGSMPDWKASPGWERLIPWRA